MNGLAGRVAVAGVGLRQYPRGKAPLPERGVLVGAIVDACADAGIDPSQIDGFVSYGDDHNEPVRLMPDLGMTALRWSSMVWGGGGGGIAAAFAQAAAGILTGQARVVVVFRALAEGVSGRQSAAVMAHHLNEHMLGAGVLSPAQACALRAQRLFERHGVPPSACEALVRADYFHGSRNPDAVAYGKPLDPDVYRNARWISEPFRLFDCSRENDGAGALVMVAAEHARDLARPPIYLAAVAQGAAKGWGDLLENDDEDQYVTSGFKQTAADLWARSGLSAADIDVVQVYENFSAQGVAALIDHGFCTYETVGEVLRYENLIAPGGRLPVNTSGGNFAQGFIHGIGMAVEAVRQLRGESSNPVPGAKTCLLTGGPGAPTVSSAIFSNQAL